MNSLSDKQQPNFYYALIPLFILLILDTLGVGLIFPILGPLFTQGNDTMLSAHASVFDRHMAYGVSIAIFTVFMFFGSPYLGDLSDHLGRKKVLLICLSGTVLGFVLSGLGIETHSLSLLIVGRALGGFSAGSQAICQASIADLSSQQNKAANFALITLANCIGFALGPMFSGYLTHFHFGPFSYYATPFYVAALFAAVNAVLLYFTFAETFDTSLANRPKPKLGKGLTMFMAAFSHKPIIILSIVILLAELGWALYFQYISLYLITSYDYGPTQLGYFMSWVGVIFGITLVIVVRLLKPFGERSIVFWSLLMMALALLLTGFTNEVGVWLLVIFGAAGSGLFYVYLLALLSNAVDMSQQGWVMGVSSAVISVSWTLGAIFTGLLAPLGPLAPLIASAGLTLLAMALMSPTIIYLLESLNQRWLLDK